MENCHGSLGFGFLVIFFMDSTMVNNFSQASEANPRLLQRDKRERII